MRRARVNLLEIDEQIIERVVGRAPRAKLSEATCGVRQKR
jgi:hypothetical protein